MRFLLAAVILGWCSYASAEEPQPRRMTLDLLAADVQLIVQVLSQAPICGTTVQQKIICDRAEALLRSIQEQAIKQEK